MKVITWNCNMVFRSKAAVVLKHKPDLLIVPECEHPDKLLFSKKSQPTSQLWFGENPHKGLGIFSYGSYTLKLLDVHEPAFRMIIPITVSNLTEKITLLAIWANNPADKRFQYVGQVWKALKHYDHLLKSENTLLAGDFNSNTIWDKPKREGNHSTVVSLLASKGIHSTYHHYFKQAQGKEAHPTLYLYRHKNKPYHLDYCFASSDLMDQLSKVSIGKHGHWAKYSDHVPVIVEFGK